MKNSEAILVTPKQFEIQECPVPEPKDHEILMKVEYVGMCGSDIHGFEFGPFIPPKDPNQKIGLGHEVAGEVVKVGSKVTRFKAGGGEGACRSRVRHRQYRDQSYARQERSGAERSH